LVIIPGVPFRDSIGSVSPCGFAFLLGRALSRLVACDVGTPRVTRDTPLVPAPSITALRGN
jgi:hypothetical protein